MIADGRKRQVSANKGRPADFRETLALNERKSEQREKHHGEQDDSSVLLLTLGKQV